MRARWKVVAVLLTVVLVVVILQFARQEPDVTTPALPPPPAGSFIWVGNPRGPFSVEQLTAVAKYEIVVLAKFHGGYEIATQLADADAIVRREPSARVLLYFSAKYWFTRNNWDTEPDASWFLRSAQGDLIYRQRRNRSDDTRYIDWRNPDARQWAVETTSRWIDQSSAAGIAFDAADPIGDFGEGTYWQEQLGGQSAVDAYNAGMLEMIDAVRAARPHTLVIYNGFSPDAIRGPNRDLDLLSHTDGGLTEQFCIELDGTTSSALQSDLDLMRDDTEHILLFKTNYRGPQGSPTSVRLSRFCYGAFLLAWRPGAHFFKFCAGDLYSVDELTDIPFADTSSIGQPTGSAVTTGNVRTREFARGFVAVNLGSRPAQVRTPWGTSVQVDVQGAVIVDAPTGEG